MKNMMTKNKVNMTELKAKNAELIKEACVYTNIAYALVEVADSFILDTDSLIKEVHCSVSGEEKNKLRYAKKDAKMLRARLHSIASQIYKLDIAEDALDDADTLYDIIKLIMDRCGGKSDKLSLIRAMVFNSFKSDYGYYDKNRK